jgi:hypothetical protein
MSSDCYLLNASHLLGLFFDSEDGGEMFFRNSVDIRSVGPGKLLLV